MRNFQERMYRIVVGLLISAIFCGEAFGFGVNLYPIRLILPLALVYSLFVFAQVIFVERKEIKITFLLGLILVMLGLIGEYLWRIFSELDKRPDTVIEEIF